MPGSGKSTLGLELSKRLQMPFVDTDDMFCADFETNIETYWHQYGELLFRIHERRIFLSCLRNTSAVISTGGGLPAFMDNMFWIKQFQSIFLNPPLEVLLQRQKLSPRPVIPKSSIGEIEVLYSRRLQFYGQADRIVSDNFSVHHQINNLLN
ncbi:MAG: hypothetical protein IT267_04010 [Saprospiraceae bacterium]|nr:hypothetical protein [Saprospiraceae bacterium]